MWHFLLFGACSICANCFTDSDIWHFPVIGSWLIMLIIIIIIIRVRIIIRVILIIIPIALCAVDP